SIPGVAGCDAAPSRNAPPTSRSAELPRQTDPRGAVWRLLVRARMDVPRAETPLELELRRRCDAGDHDGAAALAVRAYGPEVLGFLVAMHDVEADAADVLAATCEQIWRHLPAFGWRSSLRTWIYVVARSQSARFRRGAARRRRRFDALDDHPSALAAAAVVRTGTPLALRTGPSSLVALRDALAPADRELLVLRVDRGLAWLDLARVTLGESVDDAALAREAARLRKRYQILRERLLAEGRARGLVP